MGSETSKLSQSFIDNGKDLNEDEATTLIIESEQKIRLIKEERSADEKLNAAKSIAKELGAGYNSALAYEKAKISFLLDKIQEIQDGTVNPHSGAND
jgi:hypothetical protein